MGRMKEREAQLEAEVAEMLERAREVDEEEDRRYGRDRLGDELPEELAFRESRLKKIREAKAALEEEAREAAEQAEAEGRRHPGVPEDKAQRNFTDPESRIMPAPGGGDFLQACNCQAVVGQRSSGDCCGPCHQPRLQTDSRLKHLRLPFRRLRFASTRREREDQLVDCWQPAKVKHFETREIRGRIEVS